MKQLEKNSNVLKVSERSINYKLELKVRAVKENKNGKNPVQIFIENRFDLEIIDIDKPGQCLDRWRTTYKIDGEVGFFSERRGQGFTGRPSSKNLTSEEILKSRS